MSECSFCQIATHQTPARVVFETTQVIAFFPLAPAVPGHTLIIPKNHIKDIWSMDDYTGCILIKGVKEVAGGIRAALRPDGVNMINSNGGAASQTVMHLHFHLVPRWNNDNFGRIWPESPSISDEHLDRLAMKIAQALN
jgi:histidine triad (HIT) family protein